MTRIILLAVDIDQPQDARSTLETIKPMLDAGAALEVVYVRFIFNEAMARMLPGHIEEEEQRRCEEELRVLMEGFGTQAQAMRVLKGRPAQAIMDHAERIDADLIALGSRSPGLLSRHLGSVATMIVRDADRSVLVSRRRTG